MSRVSTHMQLKTKEKKDLRVGFTLLETLVAISILTVSIAGAFSVAQNGLSSTIIARDQIIAFQLAQEAIEFVKNVRDNNTYEGEHWLANLRTACKEESGNVGCKINVRAPNLNLAIQPCGNLGSCKVFKDTDGFYIQSNAIGGLTSTVFTRVIKLEPVPVTTTLSNSRQAKIIVTMSWTKGLTTKTFTVTEYIFDWQNGLVAE